MTLLSRRDSWSLENICVHNLDIMCKVPDMVHKDYRCTFSCALPMSHVQMMQKELEKAIEIEEQQVQRLMFALNKARSDAAYYRSVQSMMDDSANSD